MTTLKFKHVYVKSSGCATGKLEKDGPLGHLIECYYEDTMCGQSTFEKAERQLCEDAIDVTLRKYQDIKLDLSIGGDLMNQNGTSNYVAKKIDSSFISMFGACSNSALVIGQAGVYIEHCNMNNVLAFTSSHNKTAERQFRYPNEYGIQKKETTTTTVTGAGAVLLSNEKSDIRLTHFTIGKVMDWQYDNVNDMGKAMVPAVYDTIMAHFKDTNRTFDDYDLVISGDLSKIGYAMLNEMMIKHRFQLEGKLNDCGLKIYDINHQNVFCGGSGCACSMVVLCTDLLNQLKTGKMKRILLVASGCLHSLIQCQQKETIPTIAHAIVLEKCL